ncbi:MAG: hypothetical protein KIT84_00940 [Labilithrix sp.]|nr:hypothetical protein [Labilithrix sp.]MCW5809550.1 hypothetical protein [Labilithrix sp.]
MVAPFAAAAIAGRVARAWADRVSRRPQSPIEDAVADAIAWFAAEFR